MRPPAAGDPRPYVAVVTGAAVVTLGAAMVLAPAPAWHAGTIVAFAAIAGAYFAFGRVPIVVRWREQRIDLTLVEAVVVAALAFASPILLAPATLVALVVRSFTSRKSLVKSFFNVAQGVLASSAATVIVVLASGRVDPLAAAALGLAGYSLVNEAAIAGLFAWIERISPIRVYRERLLLAQGVSLTLGGSLGFAFIGLWLIHPVASVLALPLAAVAIAFNRSHARGERELALHRRLADDAEALLGAADDERVARVVLAAADEAIEASALELRFGGRTYEKAYDAHCRAGSISVALVGPSGRSVGSIEAWGRRGQPPLDEADRALLHHLAGWAAQAIESAAALRELDAQRAALARRERMSSLGMLVAGVAHEVNNPLTYISGNLELARMDLEALKLDAPTAERVGIDLDQMVTALAAASRGADQIAHVVRSLRTVARDRVEGDLQLVDLNRLAEDIATLVRAGLPMDIAVSWEGAPTAPRVLGQATDLHQAVLNLAKNATEALGERGSGRVHLEVRDGGTHAEVVVTDDGPGIPEDAFGRLFTPFFTTKGATGTGLGLSIVSSIARAHQGEVIAESPPASGARFILRLPKARASA